VSLLVTNVSLQQGLFESDLFLATFASHILATRNVFEKQCSMAQGRPEGAVILAAQAVIFAFSYQVHFMLINSCISYKMCYDSGERESGSSRYETRRMSSPKLITVTGLFVSMEKRKWMLVQLV
jgi:hypothetical protein